MLAVIGKELRSFFTSMLGYAIVAFYLVVLGIYFVYGNFQSGSGHFEYTLANISFMFIVLIPILTMKSMADERRNKTDQLLLTAPISVEKVVIGKYIGTVSVYLICMLLTCVYPIILSQYGELNLGLIYYSILGFTLLGLAYLSIGMFISSLTENSVISAVITFIVVLITYLMSSLSSMLPNANVKCWIIYAVIFIILCMVLYALVKNMMIVGTVAIIGEAILAILYMVKPAIYDNSVVKLGEWLSLVNPYYYFVQGVVDASYILFYVSIIVVFLFLTIQSIKKRRWN